MLEVTAIDVGQGDSLFISGPNGETMLVDAGGPVGGVTEAAEAASHFDVGEEIVSPYLWSRRIRHLDVLVLSHAHSDHMGGMPAIMRNFRPRELWVSIDPNSDDYRKLLAETKELGVQVRHFYAGDLVAWGGMQITMLAPETGYTNAHEPVNNDSLVMRMQYGRSSVLLEGDAEAPSERMMLANRRVTPVTLLKVGHHGSKTSTTQEFLAAAAPKDAVVSVGKGNTFGHPRFEVIERIAAGGAKLYRTDEFGLTTFFLGPDGAIHEALERIESIGMNENQEASMELNETRAEFTAISAEERAEEQKLIRRMQMMMNMVMQVIAQDSTLTVDEAAQMIADTRKAALAMFPGKELAYDLIWRPRFQRLMRERFRIM